MKHPIICSSFVSLIICSINYGICIFLYKLNWNIDKIQDQNGQTILSSSISLGITINTSVMDFILEIVLEKLVKWEKPIHGQIFIQVIV